MLHRTLVAASISLALAATQEAHAKKGPSAPKARGASTISFRSSAIDDGPTLHTVRSGLFVRVSPLPGASGFTVWIGDTSAPADNYGFYAEPPYEGPAQYNIIPADFALGATGPREERRFRFAPDRSAYERLAAALKRYKESPDPYAIDTLNAEIAAIPFGMVDFHITNLISENDLQGDPIKMRRLEYAVDMSFPRPAAPQSDAAKSASRPAAPKKKKAAISR